jgi:hypothetical protein
VLPSEIGDINADGRVDLSDAKLALKMAAGENASDNLQPQYPLSGCDANGNGRIDMPEIIYSLQQVAGRRR